MESTSRPSIYRPLDQSTPQIRIIHLQPGERSSPIICTLHEANLGEPESYEAVSYEWGQSSETPYTIRLNGCDFPVRENLWWALVHLRDAVAIRVLWIDALCINQADIAERSQQVSQMTKVYETASSVIAWLGMPNQGSDEGIEDMEEDVSRAHALLTRESRVPRESHRTNKSVDKFDIKNWQALSRLLHRSYWSRLWIIQELISASSFIIQCGKYCFDWCHLRLCYKDLSNPYGHFMRTLEPEEAIRFSRHFWKTKLCVVLQHREDRSTFPRFQTAQELFQLYREAKCVDARDKVYGLVGLSLECCRSQIEVDYSKSAQELGRALIRHHLSDHFYDSKGTMSKLTDYDGFHARGFLDDIGIIVETLDGIAESGRPLPQQAFRHTQDEDSVFALKAAFWDRVNLDSKKHLHTMPSCLYGIEEGDLLYRLEERFASTFFILRLCEDNPVLVGVVESELEDESGFDDHLSPAKEAELFFLDLTATCSTASMLLSARNECTARRNSRFEQNGKASIRTTSKSPQQHLFGQIRGFLCRFTPNKKRSWKRLL